MTNNNETNLDAVAAEMAAAGVPEVGTVLWQVTGQNRVRRCVVEDVERDGYDRFTMILSRTDAAGKRLRRRREIVYDFGHGMVAFRIYLERAAAVNVALERVQKRLDKARREKRRAELHRREVTDEIAAWEVQEIVHGGTR